MFEQITDFNNLYAAYKSAAAGKHDRAEVLRHDLHAEKILLTLQRQLRGGSYKHGKYRTFKVYDPKQRDVAAAPFTDRIVHHAVVRVIEPMFERGFIYDSYACRVGKGTHAAVLRLQHFLRSATDKYGEFYVLRADIRKFFASIDHAVLLNLLAKVVYDDKTLRLCQQIIDSYHEPYNLNPKDLKGLSSNRERNCELYTHNPAAAKQPAELNSTSRELALGLGFPLSLSARTVYRLATSPANYLPTSISTSLTSL